MFSLGIGGGFYWLNTWGVNQMALQRYCSMPNQRSAIILVLLTIPAISLIAVLAFYMGSFPSLPLRTCTQTPLQVWQCLPTTTALAVIR